MISSKWIELYQYLKGQIEQLPESTDVLIPLNERLLFLEVQFPKKQHRQHANWNFDETQEQSHADWLEHEAFTFVMSDEIARLELNPTQLKFLFETLMAAQMCQLAMVAINKHKHLLTENEFKTSCGLVYQQLGDYDMAKSMFEESIALNASNPLLHCHLGFTHLYLGDSELAEESFKQSITTDPAFIGGYQNLAGLYYQEGKFDLAAQYAEQAYSKDQSLISTYITATSSYLALGANDQADHWITRAFDNNISSIELVRLAGICAYQQGRLEEALEALDQYLNVTPNNFDVLNIRTHIKADLKRYDDLEPDLQQLLIFEPHDEWCLEQLFLCYFHTKQWGLAQQIMVDLSKLSAHYKITHRALINTINKKLSLDVVELN
ncbi:tetratricopeptide repeat protein [Photobacterium minamisatsumaniensis]|uniref:tetratricopeptide repeat protein n=1 Tax=Photobacterium minamisatsumaniensis TaxID=2910233 RepID=UPI003D0B4C48